MTHRTFFTSDIHFGHTNIIKFCNRPWNTVEEMNEGLIQAINQTVSPKDTLYILGDVSFMNAAKTEHVVSRLNGNKILVYGNHDGVIKDNSKIRSMFSETHDFLERNFQVGDKKVKIVMCHYALKVWNKSHHGSLHLYGHSHGSMPDDGTRSMDVGMDAVGLKPISLEEVVVRIGDRPIAGVDHHDPKVVR